METSTIKEVISTLNENLGLFLALLVTIGGIIENTKITTKKPITALFKWLGEAINKDLIVKVDKINECTIQMGAQIDSLDQKVDANERDRIRHEILSFSNSLREGCQHSKDEFQHIQELYYKYHEVLQGNGLITEEYEYIRCIYKCIYNRNLQTTYTEQ